MRKYLPVLKWYTTILKIKFVANKIYGTPQDQSTIRILYLVFLKRYSLWNLFSCHILQCYKKIVIEFLLLLSLYAHNYTGRIYNINRIHFNWIFINFGLRVIKQRYGLSSLKKQKKQKKKREVRYLEIGLSIRYGSVTLPRFCIKCDTRLRPDFVIRVSECPTKFLFLFFLKLYI